MSNTEIKFEPSARHGITPTGAYLVDVALRFGVEIETTCGRQGNCNDCAVRILKGADLLSQPTKAELEHLTAQRRKNGERLSCQAKIEKVGEICVMTTEKKQPVETTFEAFEKEFAKLPLEEKIQHLLKLETTTLGETLSYILNLPYTIGEKIRDGMAEFGLKMEEEEKKAKRPAEHKTESSEAKADQKKETVKKATVKKAATATKTGAKTSKTTTVKTAKPKAEAKTNTRKQKSQTEEKPQ